MRRVSTDVLFYFLGFVMEPFCIVLEFMQFGTLYDYIYNEFVFFFFILFCFVLFCFPYFMFFFAFLFVFLFFYFTISHNKTTEKTLLIGTYASIWPLTLPLEWNFCTKTT